MNNWENNFIETLDIFETKSKCIKKKVVCIFVKNNRILSIGLNGTMPGKINCNDLFINKLGRTFRLLNYDDKKLAEYNESTKLDFYVKYINIYRSDNSILTECDNKKFFDSEFRFFNKSCNYITVNYNRKIYEFLDLTHLYNSSNNLKELIKYNRNSRIFFKLWEDVTDYPDDNKLSHHYWSNINEIHAEMNAIANISDKDILKGSTAYISYLPCFNCSKMLALYGISKIIYKKKFNEQDKDIIKFLQSNNIIVEKWDKLEG